MPAMQEVQTVMSVSQVTQGDWQDWQTPFEVGVVDIPVGQTTVSWHLFELVTLSPTAQAVQVSMVVEHSRQLVLQAEQRPGLSVVSVNPAGHESTHVLLWRSLVAQEVQVLVAPKQVVQSFVQATQVVGDPAVVVSPAGQLVTQVVPSRLVPAGQEVQVVAVVVHSAHGFSHAWQTLAISTVVFTGQAPMHPLLYSFSDPLHEVQ